jgi:hypothetical protein
LPGDRRSCDKDEPVQKTLLWVVLIALMYAGHQDVWFWRTARPLFAGFLPVGLTYHALYCLAAVALMWALTTYAWPSYLEEGQRAGADTRRDRLR